MIPNCYFCHDIIYLIVLSHAVNSIDTIKTRSDFSLCIHIGQCMIPSFNVTQRRYQLLNIVSNRLIANDKVMVDVIDDSTLDVRMLLQHVEEHGSPTYKRLNVSSIVPIIKVSWQQCFQLFQELALSANPLDEWFCFCHFIFFVLIHSTISVRRSSAISTSRSFVVFVKRISKCIEFGTIKNCHTICFHSAKITDIIDADDISAVFYDISAIEKDGLNAWMNVIAILASKRLCQALFLI